MTLFLAYLSPRMKWYKVVYCLCFWFKTIKTLSAICISFFLEIGTNHPSTVREGHSSTWPSWKLTKGGVGCRHTTHVWPGSNGALRSILELIFAEGGKREKNPRSTERTVRSTDLSLQARGVVNNPSATPIWPRLTWKLVQRWETES